MRIEEKADGNLTSPMKKWAKLLKLLFEAQRGELIDIKKGSVLHPDERLHPRNLSVTCWLLELDWRMNLSRRKKHLG